MTLDFLINVTHDRRNRLVRQDASMITAVKPMKNCPFLKALRLMYTILRIQSGH